MILHDCISDFLAKKVQISILKLIKIKCKAFTQLKFSGSHIESIKTKWVGFFKEYILVNPKCYPFYM